jgi:ribonuclease P protein component
VKLSFTKGMRLRKRHQYKRVGHAAIRHVGRYIVVDCKENHLSHTRLGITAACRYGDAHERNRFKRIVREAFRLRYHALLLGYDVNIKPRTLAKEASMNDIVDDLLHCFLNLEV